ncbi:hypothetical protein M569_09751, partial [Genlisea aurea]
HRISSIEWNPSAVVALATSADASQVAAARADGSLEIWLVSPGSVGWHCLLTIHGDPNSRVTSLVWCQSEPRAGPLGRLFSSSIDGSISEWDLFNLKQKIVLDSIGTTIWQIASEPCRALQTNTKEQNCSDQNGHASPSATSDIDQHDSSESEEDDEDEDKSVIHDQSDEHDTRLAIACDDGSVRIYKVSDSDKLTYNMTLPRVSGRILSVTWSSIPNRIYSGSSDGYIRCWDVTTGHEIYRMASGQGSDCCIWSIVALRCGTIVSGDSSGSVRFWDGQFGTLLQTLSYHRGDVNALAASPSHNRVFSSGSDGQVILYKLSRENIVSTDGESACDTISKWIYIGYKSVHTHDVRALAVAVPICHEDLPPDEKIKRARKSTKPFEFSYHKWAHLGVPMLISGGEDTKLFAYPVKEFDKFSPHDISPAPQRLSMQLILRTPFNRQPLLFAQAAHWMDIYSVHLENGGGSARTSLVARVKSRASQKIICSAMSSSGTRFAYSDHRKPNLFELKKAASGKGSFTVNKRQLPQGLPFAHFMIFSMDSSRLLVAGNDKRIYVIDVASVEVVHTFTPCRKDNCEHLPPSEPPITKMFTSHDGQWLAAINCFGDVYVFNLETLRQHWFISRLDGAAVTSGGFMPRNGNVLIVCTSSNQVYALDVEAKQLGEWSMRNTFCLPRRFQEFPGEVIGLSFDPSSSSSSVSVYSPRAMCLIDFGMPIEKEEDEQQGVMMMKKKALLHSNGGGVKKRKQQQHSSSSDRKNFEFYPFKEPVLFAGHLSENSVLIVDRPWKTVIDSFEFQPVHRHIFGT